MTSHYKPTIVGMRRMLYAASGLVLLVGIQLFVLTEQTDRYFAWTITSPLTAAFLGGAYWSACALELLAARRAVWAEARIAVPAVLIFTTLTLLTTLLHLDKFHLSSQSPLTLTATWVWILVYAVVPPILAWLWWEQSREPGIDPPQRQPLSPGVLALVAIQAAILLALGIVLFVIPSVGAELWPWKLTPLAGRAIGAWLLGLGVAAAQVLRENDVVRVRPVQVSVVLFVALQLIALARYPGGVSWDDPRTIGYLAILGLFLSVGAISGLGQRSGA